MFFIRRLRLALMFLNIENYFFILVSFTTKNVFMQYFRGKMFINLPLPAQLLEKPQTKGIGTIPSQQ